MKSLVNEIIALYPGVNGLLIVLYVSRIAESTNGRVRLDGFSLEEQQHNVIDKVQSSF